jgi:electron transfer flavoprotein alpha subunit
MMVIIAEQQAGVLNPASLEAIAAAQTLGDRVTVVLAGADLQTPASSLADCGVTEVVTLESPLLAAYTADGAVTALAAYLRAEPPTMVLLAHTYQARDFAPRLAARLDWSFIADGTGVRRTSDGVVVVTRPIFQGKLTAEVVLEGPSPHVVALQMGRFRRDAVRQGAAAAPIRRVSAAVEAGDIRQTPDAPFREAKQAVDLSQAERIVAIGRGVKEDRHVRLARDLASSLGAELAASRPICDAGWLPMDRQVGSSGQTVAPRLYVAIGISGAIQHVVGMKGSRTIVAINRDPDAPIFEVADYGIVGDLFEVVPAIIAALARD